MQRLVSGCVEALFKLADAIEKRGAAGAVVRQLPEIIKELGVKEIIFCENGFSFKEIIATIQQLPPGTRTKFHASGSSSIVGSEYRDRKGDYIADKNQ